LRNYESGMRNGFRPRTVQTVEGELEIEIPQVREAAETFASKRFPRTPKLLRTEPLKALVVGAFVRGLSMRDVESLCEQAGLGKLSKSTASRMCEELQRFEHRPRGFRWATRRCYTAGSHGRGSERTHACGPVRSCLHSAIAVGGVPASSRNAASRHRLARTRSPRCGHLPRRLADRRRNGTDRRIVRGP